MFRCLSRCLSMGLPLFALACIFAGLDPLSAAPETGKKYALLVGINEYDHAKLPNLKYAENDVADLDVVLRKAGYEVIVLSGAEGKKSASRQPTKENVDKALAALLKKYQKGDTILLAFAGHGLQFDKECYFCPRDAKPFKDRTESLIALSAVYKELDQAFDGTKVMLVDACRNDPDPSRGSRGIDADSAPPPPKGVAALFSCSANQRAFESDELKHGIFFHYVLEALQGKGGTNEKGEVTWGRLSEYVPEKVEGQVPKLIGRDFKQTPNMKADLVGRSPVLVRLDKEKTPDDSVVKSDTVLVKTSLGDFKIKLQPEKAPKTVANFLKYVDDKHYDDLIFHRVIANYMIQAGGYDQDMKEKKTRDPIKNESGNGLKHAKYTIAMARSSQLDSATAQFYINLKDNFNLDTLKYCVFGEVIEGMDVIDKIGKVKTGESGNLKDVPVQPVVIHSIRRVSP